MTLKFDFKDVDLFLIINLIQRLFVDVNISLPSEKIGMELDERTTYNIRPMPLE